MDSTGIGKLSRNDALGVRRHTRTPYVPLWCKSNYSFLEGASHPEELVETAATLKLPGIAITDRDGVYGVVRAHEANKAFGLKLIIGSEVTLDDGATIVLLANDREGYAGLCTLVSTGRLRSPKGMSSVSWDEVCSHAKGLTALLPARSAELCAVLPDEGIRTPRESPLQALKAAFGMDLYIGISRHHSEATLTSEQTARRTAAAFDIPGVALQEVLYHDRERRPLQDVLTCIRHNCTIYDAGDRLKPNAEHDLPATVQVLRLFRDDLSLVRRTAEIAERCTFSLDQVVYRYPSERLPQGLTSAQWLRKLTLDGAGVRYPEGAPHDVLQQLEKELSIIEDLDYCGYFLTMWEIVTFCRRNNILCQGRGSAANSAVCFCLGITAVDPVRMDLLFERFLSRERAEPPDIDLDIEHNRREEVIQYMYEKYGRSHAAMVANFIRYRKKSAIRDIGKVLGISLTAADRLSRLVSYRDGDITTAIEEAGLDITSRTIDLLHTLVGQIREFPRHLSIHPGGFLLGSEPVSRLVPIENATMPDRTVIQWDKYDIESMNLFKVDLLGLGALTHLDYAFQLLSRHCDINLSMAAIPPADPVVFEMITESDTVGVFQLESRAQMAMLPRMRPKTYYDIVIEVSIVRPGPISGGMVHPYLRRRNEEEEVVYPHPDLKSVLQKTLGVPIFQEQVMKLAVVAADYTPGQADQLRRDMAAWRKSGRIEKHHDRLVSGMQKKGISEEFAEQVFNQIRGFGEYGFPESHAASFALIAYATAWMRCHHPVVFTCALLNAWPMGFYSPASIVEDAKRHGVQVLPVDIRRSAWECSIETIRECSIEAPETMVGRAERYRAPVFSPSARSEISSFGIRMGLRYVKGLGDGDWSKIRSARDRIAEWGGTQVPSRSPRPESDTLAVFLRAARLDEAALSVLARSGAFAAFSIDRRSALWRILGKDIDLDGSFAEAVPDFVPLMYGEEIAWDYAASSHSTAGHALEPYRDELRGQGLPDAAEVIGMNTGDRVSYAGLVICRQRPETASGTVFLTLEDETGFVNLVVYEKRFEEFRKVLLTSTFLGITGKVQSTERVVHVLVESAWVPKLSSKPVRRESRDFR